VRFVWLIPPNGRCDTFARKYPLAGKGRGKTGKAAWPCPGTRGETLPFE
jgi:hypothetical protein